MSCERVRGYALLSAGPPATEFNCGKGKPLPVDSLPDGCTPEGVCGLSGNIDEFVHPGAVEWHVIPDVESGPRLVARPPDTTGFSVSGVPFTGCVNRARYDPFGMFSNTVQDCLEVAYQPFKEEQVYDDATEAFSIIRGGNVNGSLPVLYQSRARYPFGNASKEGVEGYGNWGFRCVFDRYKNPNGTPSP